MKLKAMGKINLALDVVRKREDGYHEVRMIMQTVQIYDLLEIYERREAGIRMTTNLRYLPVNENNLVYRAAQLLMDEFHVDAGLEIRLQKTIPVAAGMAGGSSDAAAALVGVNRLFRLGLTRKELMERAVRLGADVPYCVMRGTALSEGIGEILTPLPPMPKAAAARHSMAAPSPPPWPSPTRPSRPRARPRATSRSGVSSSPRSPRSIAIRSLPVWP